MSPNRAPELNYYDELGVAPDASPEQIREAFRALVRLLHPDHQSDEQLKSVAERQMRNLNGMYKVLSDPHTRSQYDDLLQRRLDRQQGKLPPAPPSSTEAPLAFTNSRDVSRYAWMGAATLSCLILLWFAVDSSAGPGLTNGENRTPAPASQTEAAAPLNASSGEIARLRAELRVARTERDEALRELSALQRRRGTLSNATSAPVPEPRAIDTQAPAAPIASAESAPSQPGAVIPVIPAPSPKSPVARALTRQFGGFWFFVKSAEDKANPQLYPPEFIEATITEQNGLVRGRYRSRYRITDRAISPDVNFNFIGTVNLAATTMTADWTGPGGASGELTIKLLNENSMKVDWSADRLGSIQGLTSGTASLTRRLD